MYLLIKIALALADDFWSLLVSKTQYGHSQDAELKSFTSRRVMSTRLRPLLLYSLYPKPKHIQLNIIQDRENQNQEHIIGEFEPLSSLKWWLI